MIDNLFELIPFSQHECNSFDIIYPDQLFSILHRLISSSKNTHSIDWTVYSSSVSDAMTSDVVAPSPWKIFGCENGKGYVHCLSCIANEYLS